MKLVGFTDVDGRDFFVNPEHLLYVKDGGILQGKVCTRVYVMGNNNFLVYGTAEETAKAIEEETDVRITYTPAVKFVPMGK